MKESIRDQVVWSIFQINRVFAHIPNEKRNKDFRVGILLSDILPETGESDCKVLASAILSAESEGIKLFEPKQVVILGRRDHLVSWVNGTHPGIQIVSDWERNTKITSVLSMIVILGSAMHLTLTEEQLRGHDMSKTILMPILSGITEARMTTLLNSKLVITPYFNYEEYHISDRAVAFDK
ncbi:UNVERIFIED_CONTAM: hypothetical protein HDU68_010902 [Siphonaria sp. JEL0065]|nr:hypothetical protein HDU68_010902 [Siphonaria sp. JEL0065]